MLTRGFHRHVLAGLAVALSATVVAMILGRTPSPGLERAVVVPPTGGAPAALYFTVRNRSGRVATLRRVEMDVAERVSLQTIQAHRPSMGGMAASSGPLTRPVGSVPIPPRGAVRFAPGGYTAMLHGVRRPLVLGESVAVVAHFEGGARAEATARVVAYADLDTMLTVTGRNGTANAASPSIEEGERLYRSNGCASCHGPAGEGDGPVGQTLTPPPRDFRDATAFKNGAGVEAVAQTIATGIPLGGAMPLYAHLTNTERLSLAQYVLSLRTQTSNRNPEP